MTRPLDGRLRTAVGQSVGAGCCLGGTLSSQIRHIPGGGRYALGTSSPPFWACATPAIPTVQARARKVVRRLIGYLQRRTDIRASTVTKAGEVPRGTMPGSGMQTLVLLILANVPF